MGCRSDYSGPSARQKESLVVSDLLTEVGKYEGMPLREGDSRMESWYGDVNLLDKNTAKLCKFCKKNDVSGFSLELQIWWRDHQAADVKREESEEKGKLKKEALAKISKADRKLLGL